MSVQVSIPIDETVKQQFDSICESAGDSSSNVISIFITNAVRLNSIPSNEWTQPKKEQQLKPKRTREEVFGCMRGKFKMADDFDAPLEDFKEYME